MDQEREEQTCQLFLKLRRYHVTLLQLSSVLQSMIFAPTMCTQKTPHHAVNETKLKDREQKCACHQSNKPLNTKIKKWQNSTFTHLNTLSRTHSHRHGKNRVTENSNLYCVFKWLPQNIHTLILQIQNISTKEGTEYWSASVSTP